MRYGQIRSIRVFQAGLADKFQISLSIEQEEGDEDDEAQEEHREDVEEHEDALALDQDIDIDDEAREMDGLDHDDVNKLERQRQRRSAQNNKNIKNNKQRDGSSSSNNNKKKKRRSIKSYLVALKPVSIPLMFDTEWPTTPVLYELQYQDHKNEHEEEKDLCSSLLGGSSFMRKRSMLIHRIHSCAIA